MATAAKYGTDLDTKIIQREALLILFDNLNDKIDELEQDWIAQDDDLYSRLGQTPPDWSYEHIADENFHPGNLSPLLSRPTTEFPNCCTTAFVADPLNTDDDEGELYRIRLSVEVMVKSQKNEQESNARIENTLEAVHKVFMDNYDNRTLNHTICDLGRPRQTKGEVFIARDDNGARWFWQGGSLEYPVLKYTSLFD